MDKGEGGGGRQKLMKTFLNIINIYFAIVDKGQRGGGGRGVKTLIPFLWIKCQVFFMDPSLTIKEYNRKFIGTDLFG